MNKKSKGAVSNALLILGVVLIIVIIIVFVLVRINASRNAANKEKEEAEMTQNNEPPPPVYETQLGDVKFIFQGAQNIGNVLLSEDKRFRQDLFTTERFIRVAIGAQNKGKENVKKGTWDLGNIIDSEGRIFLSVDATQGYYMTNDDVCGSLLKPEFAPVSCVRYYEVSNQSTGLKLEVNLYPPNSMKKSETALMDLILE